MDQAVWSGHLHVDQKPANVPPTWCRAPGWSFLDADIPAVCVIPTGTATYSVYKEFGEDNNNIIKAGRISFTF